MRLPKAILLFFNLLIASSATLIPSLMAQFVRHNGVLSALPLLASNLVPITAANIQDLTVVARLCAIHGDSCGSPIAWSPNSTQLAIAGTAGVELYDVRNLGQAPIYISASQRRFEQFSPDWSLIAIINHDGSVDLWNAGTANKTYSIPLANPNIGTLAFASTGRYLALTSYDFSVRLWDVKAKTQTHIWADHQNNDPITSFGPDGSIFAVSVSPTVQSQAIQLWDTNIGQVVAELNMNEFDPIISQIAFSPDSRLLAISSNLNTTIWNTKTHTKLFVLDMDFKFDWAFAAAFSPAGTILAAYGRQRIYLWDVATQERIALIDGLGTSGVSVRFGNDGSWLFSTDRSDIDFKPHVQLWDTTSGKNLSDFAYEQSPVLSPDGALLATNEVDGSVIIRAIR